MEEIIKEEYNHWNLLNKKCFLKIENVRDICNMQNILANLSVKQLQQQKYEIVQKDVIFGIQRKNYFT